MKISATIVHDKYRKWRIVTFIQNGFKNENYENGLVMKWNSKWQKVDKIGWPLKIWHKKVRYYSLKIRKCALTHFKVKLIHDVEICHLKLWRFFNPLVFPSTSHLLEKRVNLIPRFLAISDRFNAPQALIVAGQLW